MALQSYYRLRTFLDIQNAAIEALRIQPSDIQSLNRIKRNINISYLNQVVSSSRSWTWLNKTAVVSTQPFYEDCTVSVQQNIAYITFARPIGGSRKNWFIGVAGSNEVHQIFEHEDGGTVATLTTRFSGLTNTAARFRIWSDCVPLPADCQTVRTVSSSHKDEPLTSVSLQQLRKYQARNEGFMGKPHIFAEGPRIMPNPYAVIAGLTNPISRQSDGLQKTLYFSQDPSQFLQPGDRLRVVSGLKFEYEGDVSLSAVSAENKSIQYTARNKRIEANTAVSVPNEIQIFSIAEGDQDPYPTLVIHPSMDEYNHVNNLIVDYQAYPEELLNPDDEPMIPIQHRQVLFFGAMWLSCDRDTDMERAAMYKGLMDQEIQRMVALTTMPARTPKIEFSKDYIKSKMRLPAKRFIIY